jgi:hypothetical protein
VDERAMGSLLDDDMLRASREEAVLEAVVRGMKGARGDLLGRGLLSKIRLCVGSDTRQVGSAKAIREL